MIFGTLGPQGSNHDWVTRRYLEFHQLSEVEIRLFLDFDLAFEELLTGGLNFVIQVAVHPSVTDTVARYRDRAHLVDTFISPSQPMAVLTRSDVAEPKSLGLQPATRGYIDTSRWETLLPETSTVTVGEGLLEGRYDSGITLARYADEHPGRFRVEETVGTVVDPWLVYGAEDVCGNKVLAWPGSPASRLYRS